MTLVQLLWAFLAAVNAFIALRLANTVLILAVQFDWTDDDLGLSDRARKLVGVGAIAAVLAGVLAVFCAWRAFQ